MRFATSVLLLGTMLGTAKAQPTPLKFELINDFDLANCFAEIAKIENVVVLRWQGGIPIGSINLITDEGPLKIDLKKHVESKIRARGKSIVIDPRWNSGQIVIVVHAAKDKSKVRRIDVAILDDHLVVDKAGRSTRINGTSHWEGEIPAAKDRPSIGTGGWVEEDGKSKQTWIEFTAIDGREYQILDITLLRETK